LTDEADTPDFERKGVDFPSFPAAFNFEVEISLFFPDVGFKDQFFKRAREFAPDDRFFGNRP
jgi:hypothetical protein